MLHGHVPVVPFPQAALGPSTPHKQQQRLDRLYALTDTYQRKARRAIGVSPYKSSDMS